MSLSCLGCPAPVPPKAVGTSGPVGEYCSRRCYMHHYHAERAWRSLAISPPSVRACPSCEATWSPLPVPGAANRVYCSDRCKARSRWKPTREMTCACGAVFATSGKRRHCSDRCARRVGRDHPWKTCAADGCDRPKRAKGLCNYHYRKARGEKPPEWSDARRDAYHRRRARKAGTSSPDRPVLLSEIRERDKNRCHLCRKRVSSKPYPHPMSASLDHVIPLSHDEGHHVPENVRLAHLVCNTAKGNRGGNEQLMLIG